MIVKSVVLRCEPARAFTLFTENAGGYDRSWDLVLSALNAFV